jgi:hypothetical protein
VHSTSRDVPTGLARGAVAEEHDAVAEDDPVRVRLREQRDDDAPRYSGEMTELLSTPPEQAHRLRLLAPARAQTKARRQVLEHQRDRTLTVEKATRTIIPALFHRTGRPVKSFRRAWITACRAVGSHPP